jgi:hypothetical protein
MFESSVERTIIGAAIALWFAHGWYLNTRLREVHQKLDLVLECFDGLRDYLYEIDPQFDDERRSNRAVFNEESLLAGMDDFELLKRKKEEGKRTLNTPFIRR